MKLKLITKYWPYAANLKNCMNVCSIHFYLVNIRHFQNHRVVYFLDLFDVPFGVVP